MREGLELLLRHAFGDLRLHRVQASIQPENERSIALVRAAGFRKEGLALRYLKIGGRWRDHEHWAITGRGSTPAPRDLGRTVTSESGVRRKVHRTRGTTVGRAAGRESRMERSMPKDPTDAAGDRA